MTSNPICKDLRIELAEIKKLAVEFRELAARLPEDLSVILRGNELRRELVRRMQELEAICAPWPDPYEQPKVLRWVERKSNYKIVKEFFGIDLPTLFRSLSDIQVLPDDTIRMVGATDLMTGAKKTCLGSLNPVQGSSEVKYVGATRLENPYRIHDIDGKRMFVVVEATDVTPSRILFLSPDNSGTGTFQNEVSNDSLAGIYGIHGRKNLDVFAISVLGLSLFRKKEGAGWEFEDISGPLLGGETSLHVLSDESVVVGRVNGYVTKWTRKNRKWIWESIGKHDTKVSAVQGIGERIISTDVEGVIRIWIKGKQGWEMEDEVIPSLRPSTPPTASTGERFDLGVLQALPDGRIVVGGQELTIWGKREGTWTPESHPEGGAVVALQVLPDGKIYTANKGGKIFIWDGKETEVRRKKEGNQA